MWCKATCFNNHFQFEFFIPEILKYASFRRRKYKPRRFKPKRKALQTRKNVLKSILSSASKTITKNISLFYKGTQESAKKGDLKHFFSGAICIDMAFHSPFFFFSFFALFFRGQTYNRAGGWRSMTRPTVCCRLNLASPSVKGLSDDRPMEINTRARLK